MNLLNTIIETEHLILRPTRKGDGEHLYKEFTEEITKYMYPKPNESVEAAEKWIAEVQKEIEEGANLQITVIKKNTGEFLGCGGINVNTKTPELGIWIKKSAHGYGYGREAVTGLKHWADENLDYDYLLYPVDKKNIASRKIAESLGGEVKREFKSINMSGNELDEVEYHIYKI